MNCLKWPLISIQLFCSSFCNTEKNKCVESEKIVHKSSTKKFFKMSKFQFFKTNSLKKMRLISTSAYVMYTEL